MEETQSIHFVEFDEIPASGGGGCGRSFSSSSATIKIRIDLLQSKIMEKLYCLSFLPQLKILL